MAKQKQPFDMGEHTPDKFETQAWLWCIRNGIYISPFAIAEGRWGMVIKNKGSSNKDPKTYTKGSVWPKMYEYYKYYFKKYENKI
jgi:hypothetical protein